jgi:hypothetical protein
MLSATVHFTDISHAISYVEDVKYGRTKEPPNSDYPLLSLAERIVEDPVVPFERSPLEALSIKEIISTGSGIGIGAYLGFFAAAGSPLVFLTVPLGMVLCGGAVGFSKGLEQLVYAKMLRLMRDDE